MIQAAGLSPGCASMPFRVTAPQKLDGAAGNGQMSGASGSSGKAAAIPTSRKAIRRMLATKMRAGPGAGPGKGIPQKYRAKPPGDESGLLRRVTCRTLAGLP